MCENRKRAGVAGAEGGRGAQATERSLGLISNAYLTLNQRGEARGSSGISTWTEHLLFTPLTPSAAAFSGSPVTRMGGL